MRARQVSVLQTSGAAGTKVWSGAAITNAAGQWSVDFSSAGFTSTPVVSAQAISQGTAANQSAIANVTARSAVGASGTVTIPALAVLGVLSVSLAGAGYTVQVTAMGA